MLTYDQESGALPKPGPGVYVDGGDFRVFDRPFDVSQTIAAGDLVSLNAAGTYWNKSTLKHVDAAEWAAATVYAVGAFVVPTSGEANGHFYECTAREGDFKTHATEEPTWVTNGSTVTDDAVTWTDCGVFDTVACHFGIAVEAVTSTSETHPVSPVIQVGAIKRSACSNFPPDSVPVGVVLGGLILT